MRPSRWNFWMTVGNGALVTFGAAFFAIETVMAGLVFQLTASPFCVGMLSSVNSLGWLWPQVFVGSFVEHRARKMPVYVFSATVRTLSLFTMTGLLYIWRGNPVLLFTFLITIFAVYSSAGGVCVVPFMDIVGKAIPKRDTPMLFAYRQLFGGLLGFAAGGVVYFTLSNHGASKSLNEYGFLIFVGTLFNVIAYTMFCFMREPVEPVSSKRVSVRDFLRRGPVMFREDQDYRRFYFFRCCWALTTMSQALYVPYAVEALHAPARMTGWFTAVVTLAGGLSAALWGRVSARYSEVVLMRLCAAVLCLSPFTALLLALLSHLPGAQALVASHYRWAYLVMYGCASAALNGYSIAGSVYMLALAPPQRRPTYIAFMNTVSVPLMFAPVLAGYLVRYLTYPVMFGVSTAAGLGAVACAYTLRTHLHQTHPVPEVQEDVHG